MENELNNFLNGEKLYGDDFSQEQIIKWYEQEKEAYANLGSKDLKNYRYPYHEINRIHGFNKLKELNFKNVLGLGSAWGYEFMPIISKISNITIIEPSDSLKSNIIGNVIPEYVKPDASGRLPFPDNSFDLITCFGTLHHIPNVSFVISELVRVLVPNGYLLIREPIVSMGDWTKPRDGLTKNERGIPILLFDSIIEKLPVKSISREFCFTLSSFINRYWRKIFKNAIFTFKLYVYFDKFISKIFKNNVHYHALRKRHKIAPSSIFYVLQKTT